MWISWTGFQYDSLQDRQGRVYKAITDYQTFDTYQHAVDYVNSQQTGSFIIGSNDPFISPIQLDALTSYQLVYSSTGTVDISENRSVPEVKVFQYTGQ